MGRSKFPGKPSKHILRKRVNVLPPTGEITNVESNSSLTVSSVVENKQDEDLTDSDGESAHTETTINKNVSIKRRLTRKLKSSIRNKNVTKRALLSKMCTKASVKTKLKTSLSRKAVHTYNTSCHGKVTKESTNLVGKFVLPTRSVHSSRVIKPNKRFISDMNEAVTLKKKVTIVKRHCVKQEDSKSVFSESGSLNSDSDKTTFTNGHKVVLRQARLKLPNEIGLQGPFSSKPNSSSGIVTCGVCGAVRFYRFLKQARKFNIYSCESCRKFIAKMIKRQACGNKNNQITLVCNKGQGNCHVPTAVKNQQWRLSKCGYRCPACWLKICLRAFQIPPSIKQGLSGMLPKNMQGSDIDSNNSQPPSLWQANVETKIVIEKPQETTTLKQRPVRFKNPKAQAAPSLPISNSDIKRQKIDLKGPRVKHVCRSASIVLGQPLATFPESEKKCDNQEQVNDIKIADEKIVGDKTISDVKFTIPNKSDSILSEPESNCSDRTSKNSSSDSTDFTTKREKLYRNATFVPQSSSETKAPERKKNLVDPQLGILTDFWDGYDPETVCQNGFCIIGSEQFTMSSICFLCGSAGQEPMLYCSICCEPYHSFCLEQAQSSPIDKSLKYYMWICPRCTTCTECNKVDRQKISCQKCLKAYHPECFNSKWNNDDKSMVCSKCMKCKSCGTLSITKFVGNLPLCITCFKLRKKGNFCPVCQHCYDDNECCSKMMECAKCSKWVHAKCEHLTEEQYQMLSILPESIEYVCAICSKTSTPLWRKAINNEMKMCFSQILRQLSKNKTARYLLKLSPLNNTTSLNKTITNARKVQFMDESMDVDNNNSSKEPLDINKIYSFEENEKYEASLSKVSNVLSVVDIKNKLLSNEYTSIREFNKEIEESLKLTKSEQLLKIYHSIFQDVFPWYNQSQNEEFSGVLEKDPDNESQNMMVDEKPFVNLSSIVVDTRTCSFCKGVGDGVSHRESRLLYCGQNEWVHANCALWSSEVYEEIDGSLQNVQNALNRGRMIRCAHCKQKGASVGCCYKGCHETYHFPCARLSNLKFMYDKTVYCATHDLPKKSHTINADKDFDIDRCVFVELDQKKKKYSEIDKTTVMIGSLCIKNLGKIDPIVSDTSEYLIPVGFVCTRLFWSTVEPWKLVPYTITTSIKNTINNTLVIDKNFTIDHSCDKIIVDKLMREINAWQRDIDKKFSDTEFDDDEEQQNGADILSPELTDAILEELPHDLLDGISVQDIFPKFSYDELIDYKSDLNNLEGLNEPLKRTDLDEDVDTYLKSKDTKRGRIDPNKIDSLCKSRPCAKTCSLTLSCKLDSSLSPAMKKRKMAPARDNNVIYQLLQVDGNFDDSSSSECGSPTGLTTSNPWGTYISEEPVTCNKCQSTYRTQASYQRHLESCEMLCTSDSDSEVNTEQEIVATYINQNPSLVENQVMVNASEPVVISSFESFQSEIHTSVLNTQSFVASKSASEVIPAEIVIPNITQTTEQKTILQALPINTVTPITLETTQSDPNYQSTVIGEPSISIQTNQPQFCVNQTVPLCVNQPITLQQNSIQVNPTSTYSGNPILSINPSGSISLNPVQPSNSITINQINQQPIQQPIDFHQAQSVTIQSIPYNNLLNVGSQNQYTLNSKLLTNPVLQSVNIPNTQWVKQVTKPTLIAQKAVKTKTRSRTLAAKRSHFEEGETIILPQNSPGQVIVQHLPSTNYVPFVDTFQQPGQNVQYVATITPQVNTVPTQSLVQIQPDNNIISIVPGLQQAMYIQQPRVENQLVVDSNGTLGWSQQQTVQPVYYGFETIVQNTVMQSQQFLPTTMPGVLTANSSYSTTTQVFQTSKLEPVLDVSSNSFVLVNPGQLVNSQSIVNSQPIVNSQQIVNSQSQTIINAQPIINSHQTLNHQPVVHSQSIVNSQPVVSSQPIINSQSIVNTQSINHPIVNSQPVVNSPSIVNSQTMSSPQSIRNSQQLHSQQLPVISQPAVSLQHMVNSHPSLVNNSLQTPQSSNNNSHTLTNPVISQPLIISHPVEFQQAQSIKTTLNNVLPHRQELNNILPNRQEIRIQEVNNVVPQRQVVKTSRPQIQLKPSQPQTIKYSQASHKPMTPVIGHGISLPTAPFVSEQRIPTNIVTPIPKPSSTPSRPMSRVLPMPTNNTKEAKKFIFDDEKLLISEEKKKALQVQKVHEIKANNIKNVSKIDSNKRIEIVESKTIRPAFKQLLPTKPSPVLKEEKKDECVKPELTKNCVSIEKVNPLKMEPLKIEPIKIEKCPKKEVIREEEEEKPVEISIPEDTRLDKSLKLIFQKQGQDGTYKISSNFFTRQPIQVAPLKPIKSSMCTQNQPTSLKQTKELKSKMKEEPKPEEKLEKIEDTLKPQVTRKENENTPTVLYTMETQDGFKYSSSSVGDLWSKVLDAVQSARAAHNMPPLPTNNGSMLNSLQILGFKPNGSKYLIEQLPGANKCTKYKSIFNFPPHPSDIDNDLTQDHIHGAIRCAPYENKKDEPFDMFGWLSSQHRQPEEISLDNLEILPRRVINLPMAMKFRQLKLTSKYSVGVYRSCIHGRGLFCLRDIEAGEMVIEYAGEVIRSILTDKREKYYNSKGIGCYMFRVDDNFVVDATMKGNAARFINHSCDPNCYSRVVEILGHKHIIIFALRRILSGEELTYDYKFPFEEDKIPCTCGSRKCRKFLN
ncbi:histone-lysine N-methyltransferase trithorax [Diorhabda sublineata]|uniref:histone-lysine N-methyltransferase trithorax n=1 Tax=Diorhabda sublineata TaxID=1163346 RepID=UPI0024E1052E|nr:histone-lysine N-methyltransferase trithorax [Diorhabda sublineata]